MILKTDQSVNDENTTFLENQNANFIRIIAAMRQIQTKGEKRGHLISATVRKTA